MAHRPRVSCLMPTRGRAAWLPGAVAGFLRQEGVVDAELLVVSEDAPPAGLAALPRGGPVRWVACPPGLPLGSKRNLAVAEAAGDLLLHWDDDDLQAPDRLRRQLRALARPGVQVCGASRLWLRDLRDGSTWRYRYGDPQPWVAGATLAYTRAYARRHPFAALDVGEDNAFVAAALPGELLDLADAQLCLCSLHDGNTSPRRTTGPWWQRRAALPAYWQARLHEAAQAAAGPWADTVGLA